MIFDLVEPQNSDVQTLLGEYFAFRDATFPTDGGYHVKYPADADYENSNGTFIVARDENGGLLGCAGIKRIGEQTFEIKNLWSRPAARGQGVGTALVTELERWAAKQGATTIRLDTNRALVDAMRLYQKLGYRSIPDYNGNANATDWFEKKI